MTEAFDYLHEEFEWHRNLSGRDIGLEMIRSMTYTEAYKILEPLILELIATEKRLTKNYRKILKRTSSHYAPDTAQHEVLTSLVWAGTFGHEELISQTRLRELLRYWQFNEGRRVSHKARQQYPKQDFQALLDQAKSYPIESLYPGELRTSGSRLCGRCPFHEERTPSFFIFPDSNCYHCFGCQAHGDAINFYQELTGESFKEVVEKLAEKM